MSITDYCCRCWHKFDGVRPSSHRDRRASLYMGWVDFANFGKYGLISRKRHNIGIFLLWIIYRKSYTVYRMVTLPMTLSDLWPPKWPILGTNGPLFASLAGVKLDTSNLVNLLVVTSSNQLMTCCPQMELGQGHVTFSYFGKIVAISRKLYNIAT